MSVEEVLLQQSFDIDHPKSEFANHIATSMIKEFNLIYFKEKNKDKKGFDPHIESINKSIEKAEKLGMNYSMFQKDLAHVSKIKNK